MFDDEKGRVRLLNDAPLRTPALYVLYWAQINRRLDSNHGLSFAADLANRLELPLLVYEGLTCSHPWANERFHTFIREGVADNAERAKQLGLGYVFYERRTKSAPNDVLYRLAREAAALVTDDYPGYMARTHNASVPEKIGIPYYVVDSSCIVPMSKIPQQQYAAYTIRPKIHRLLDEYLQPVDPIKIKRKWVGPVEEVSAPEDGSDIDASVPASRGYRGGRKAALKRLHDFLENDLHRYAKYNREPSEHATSRLSSYLHFGHISSLEIALAVKEHAREHKLIPTEFLEELIVRRELTFNFASNGPDPHKLSTALPKWAQESLQKHDKDKRDVIYTREQLETGATYDELWNATQQELLRDGVIHGYYRMYWGKKIIEWTRTHQDALDIMIYLHDKYALDGRDPNTYTNVLWCFGLHDRPWTERPVFGMIRYMNLAGMKRKTNVAAYIQEQRWLSQ